MGQISVSLSTVWSAEEVPGDPESRAVTQRNLVTLSQQKERITTGTDAMEKIVYTEGMLASQGMFMAF